MSTDDGESWDQLGPGFRITGGWRITGTELSGVVGSIRATGRTCAAGKSGNSSSVEQVIPIDFTTKPPLVSQPTAGLIVSRALPVSYALTEAGLANSVKLEFSDGETTRTLTLGATAATIGSHSLNFDPTDPTGTAGVAVGEPIPDGVYAFSLSYQDADGNPAAISIPRQVVVDNTAPTFLVPNPIVVEADGATGTVVTFDLTVDDLLDPDPSVTANPPSGTVFPIGTTVVTVTGKDWALNTREQTFTVTVRDTIAPSLTGEFAPRTISTGSGGNVSLPDFVPLAVTTDAVGVTSVTQNPPAGSPVSPARRP